MDESNDDSASTLRDGGDANPRALLAAFVCAPGSPLSRVQLIERTLGRDAYISDRVVHVQTARLGKAIGDDGTPLQPGFMD